MRASGIPCWLSDLDWVIQHLPGCSLSLPPLPIISEESILALIKSITAETNSRLQTEIDYSNRLALLQHRLEPQKTGPNKLITRTLRHYLTHVYKSHHRLSLTRLLCGDMVPITFHSSPARIHSLNLGENHSKRCRACLSPLQPESPQHVLLQCTAIAAITTLRNEFLVDVAVFIPLPTTWTFTNVESLYYLKAFIFNWSTVRRVARFIHEVVVIWKAFTHQELDGSYDESSNEND